MGLLNLALGQLLGLFLPLAALLVGLYFYDRSRRNVLVSTLRFWPRRPAPAVRQRHRRIQHPLSLLLQLAALLLLLLAIADPRPAALAGNVRHRVILLDTSAVMAQSSEAGRRLIDEAKALARAYLQRVPQRDPILLIEADGAPTVRVPFTRDRPQLLDALRTAEPGWTELDLNAAGDLALGTLRLGAAAGPDGGSASSVPGEVVYVGPGRISQQPVRLRAPLRLRYLETGAPQDAVGILALRAAADPSEPGTWGIELQARNYSEQALTAELEFFFENKRLGHRPLRLPARNDAALRFTLRTRRPGQLRAQANVPDAYAGNNAASLELPAADRTRLEILDATRTEFEPLLAPGGRLEPAFVETPGGLDANAIHVWARGAARESSERAIYFSPPGTASPVAESGTAFRSRVASWSPSHPLARGVRDRDLMPTRTRVFAIEPGDEIVAATSEGPVIVARTRPGRRFVAFGFDLADDAVRGRLAAPLLFANAVSWLDSDAFRPETVEARAPGPIEVAAPNSSLAQVAVRTAAGDAVPWLLSDGTLRFYAGARGTYRVTTADRRLTLFLNQPELPAAAWQPPEGILRGLPPAGPASPDPWLPWPWLAALAGLLLLYDWIRYGRGRRLAAPDFAAVAPGAGTPGDRGPAAGRIEESAP